MANLDGAAGSPKNSLVTVAERLSNARIAAICDLGTDAGRPGSDQK
jgi:hypothetical protein